MNACPCVQLPASFAERETLPGLAGVPPLQQQGTPLQRGDPSAAWYDAATVVSVVSTLSDLLKG